MSRKLESDVCYRVWVAPSGESYQGNRSESNGSLLPGGWLKVTCGLTACTSGSASGSTISDEHGKTLDFYPNRSAGDR